MNTSNASKKEDMIDKNLPRGEICKTQKEHIHHETKQSSNQVN